MSDFFEYPDLDQKFDALREALEWAAGCKVVWINQKDGGRVREPREVWAELKPRMIQNIGKEIRNEIRVNDAVTPRQELLIGRRVIAFELRFKSRNQEHKRSAWYAASRAQLRLGSRYIKGTWLQPFNWGLATVGEIVDLEQYVLDRAEDVANLEFDLNTFVTDKDASAIGTWIEHVEVSSNKLRHTAAIQANGAIQLDEELLP